MLFIPFWRSKVPSSISSLPPGMQVCTMWSLLVLFYQKIPLFRLHFWRMFLLEKILDCSVFLFAFFQHLKMLLLCLLAFIVFDENLVVIWILFWYVTSDFSLSAFKIFFLPFGFQQFIFVSFSLLQNWSFLLVSLHESFLHSALRPIQWIIYSR